MLVPLAAMRNQWFLCLLAVFLLHQFVQKILGLSSPFIDAYLDDVLCIPLFLQLWNWEKRFLFGQKNYRVNLWDSLILTSALALLFEFGFTKLSTAFTYDNFDFIAYFLGWLLYWGIVFKD